MKWDLVQGDFIKKLYSGAKVWYHIEINPGGMSHMIHLMNSYVIFRCPEFFFYIAFPEPCMNPHNLIKQAWDRSEQTLLTHRRVELMGTKYIQIFVNAETGDEIKVNKQLYQRYVEKVDQLTFWGSDYRSPVFAINGDIPDPENIVFMVLPIV